MKTAAIALSQNSSVHQFVTQLLRRAKMYRVESEFFRRGHIRQRIINKDALLGAASGLLQQEIEDLAVRLDQSGLARNHNQIEPVEELEAFAHAWEGLR